MAVQRSVGCQMPPVETPKPLGFGLLVLFILCIPTTVLLLLSALRAARCVCLFPPETDPLLQHVLLPPDYRPLEGRHHVPLRGTRMKVFQQDENCYNTISELSRTPPHLKSCSSKSYCT